MTSTTPPRRIAIENIHNLRDVGGYPVDDGGATAWGRLFRSDVPRLGHADAARLRGLGLRTVLDLRDDDECAATPSAFASIEVQVQRRPLGVRSVVGSLVTPDPAGDVLGALYCAAAAQRGREIAAAVAALGKPGALPALVHCTAGKDRTGIVVALALSSVGVSDDEVAADYALTSTYLTPGFFTNPALQVPAARANRKLDFRTLAGAEAGSMLRLLRFVRESDGTARDYLLRNGASAADLDALHAALVEPVK